MSIEGSAENDLLLYYDLSKSFPKEAVVSIAGFRHYVMEHNFVQYSDMKSYVGYNLGYGYRVTNKLVLKHCAFPQSDQPNKLVMAYNVVKQTTRLHHSDYICAKCTICGFCQLTRKINSF